MQINRRERSSQIAALLSSSAEMVVWAVPPPLRCNAPAAASLHYQTLRDRATPRALMQRSYAALLHN